MTNKKWIGFGIVLVVLLLVVSAYPFTIGMVGMPSPAAVYCDEMGGKLADDMCKFKDVECNPWDFYEGKCGKEHNHCDGASITATTGCKYSSECAECLAPEGGGKQSWRVVDEALGIEREICEELGHYTEQPQTVTGAQDFEMIEIKDGLFCWVMEGMPVPCWIGWKGALGNVVKCMSALSFGHCRSDSAFKTLESCEEFYNIEEPIPCPSVCVPVWFIEEGKCTFGGCASGCTGYDGVTTFEKETECKKSSGESVTIIDQVVEKIETSDITSTIAEKTGFSTSTTSKLIIAYFVLSNIFLVALLIKYFKRKR